MVNYIGMQSTPFVDKKDVIIQPLVPLEIKIKNIKSVGAGQTPQIVYHTKKGNCSTFLSKAQFLNCLRCFLQIKQQNISKIKSYKFQKSGINIDTENSNYFIPNSEIKDFLERYNRAILEKLEVELTSISAVVRNPIKGTVAEVNQIGCTCADQVYRHTICKHQIATQLYLDANKWGSMGDFLQQNQSEKWEEKILTMAKISPNLGQ
ncbi:MAG: hypothetical protein AB4080_21590 [Trichodesmium sp.]